MKDGFYLRSFFRSGYHPSGYVYERNLWLKEGLVLTDDHKVLFRESAFYTKGCRPERVVDGRPLFLGPPPDMIPDEPLPWPPFCVDGLWGYGDACSGEIKVELQWAFCDHFNSYDARFSAKGDFSDLKKECYDGAWGLYNDEFEVVIPPVYQHLSCPQEDVILAKKDGRWGVLDRAGDSVLPFVWDEMYFAQSVIVAGEKAEQGMRYSLFSDSTSLSQTQALIDGLTAVTVPEGEPWDGYHFKVRLIQRDGRWGVLHCPEAEIVIEPGLSREEAEACSWRWEDPFGEPEDGQKE